jgi:hypothetical protein
MWKMCCSHEMHKDRKASVLQQRSLFHGDEFTSPSCGSVVVPITSQQGIDAYDFHKDRSCLDVND